MKTEKSLKLFTKSTSDFESKSISTLILFKAAHPDRLNLFRSFLKKVIRVSEKEREGTFNSLSL